VLPQVPPRYTGDKQSRSTGIMPVIVVARWQARPGNEAALVAGGLRLWREFYNSPEPAVFQSIQDASIVIYIDEWNRRGEFLLRQSRLPAQLDALCDAPGSRTYFRSLHEFRRTSGAAPTVGVSMYQSPPSAEGSTMHYVQEQMRPRLEALPGCLRRAEYQNLDDPGHFLVIAGYQSGGDRDEALRRILQRMDIALMPLGVKIERYQARTE
jgi:hypothetical protein